MAANKSKRTIKLQKPRSAYDPNYFSLPHPALGALTFCSLIYLVVTTLSPHSLPDFLWPLAQFGKYMGTQHINVCIGFCFFSLIAHSTEAAYAGKVCQDRGYSLSTTIKWALSTFIFGFPSMLRLLPHKPRSKSKAK